MEHSIRYARAGDGIKDLWAACFPGEDAFTDYFFDELYDPSRALLCVTGAGRPAAMLHMIPYTMVWLGRETPVIYVYGVGTHPDFRRRGLAAALMDQALFEMHLRGVLFSVLIPQEDWLFDFYRPFGYAPVCTRPPRAYAFSGTPRAAGERDIPMLSSLYETALAGRARILRREEHWRAVFRELALGGGHVLLDGTEGYAVYPNPSGPPSECFGPGARETGPEGFFGCLRVVDAARVCALARQAGLSVPTGKLDDLYAPWNIGALDEFSVPGNENTLDAADLAECLFAGQPPYMQLMHN